MWWKPRNMQISKKAQRKGKIQISAGQGDKWHINVALMSAGWGPSAPLFAHLRTKAAAWLTFSANKRIFGTRNLSLRRHLLIEHIMDSCGLCNWYSQLTARFLHNSYSSRCRPMHRFFLISYINWRVAWPTYSASQIHKHHEEHGTGPWTLSGHTIAY